MLPKKILIADDEPNILLSLDFLMRKNGFNVFLARDGDEAIELIKKEHPDVVLLDIMMPTVDGYEVCEFIRKEANLAHVKVVFLTAKGKNEDQQKGYDVGADLYITKPFSTKELVKQIKELVAIN